MKVFVFDPLWADFLTPQNIAALAAAKADVSVTSAIAPLAESTALFAGTEPRILALNPDYVDWSFPAEAYAGIPNLKAIVTPVTSFGWIAAEAATAQGIPIVNVKDYSTDAVADWAVMGMLNVARRMPLLIKNNFPLNFGSDYVTYQGQNLKGKTAGIIGLGNIGSAIAERCKGLGMEVIYWSQSPKNAPYQKTDLATLFREADVIFPAMADNADTQKIITDTLLHSMKSTTLFVSIVHKYYNHALLVQKVKEGSLFGYACEEEKPGTFNSYEGNIWAVPAYAWCTGGSLRGAMDKFVQAIADAAVGKFPNKVN